MNNKNIGPSVGMGAWQLFLVFLLLKLSNHIDWSWWLVLLPISLSFGTVLAVAIAEKVLKRVNKRLDNTKNAYTNSLTEAQELYKSMAQRNKEVYNATQTELQRRIQEEASKKKPVSPVERLNKANGE